MSYELENGKIKQVPKRYERKDSEMFCSHCGKEISDDSKVCGYCGTPIDMKRQENSNQQTSQHVYGEPETNFTGQTGSYETNRQYQSAGYGTPQNMDGGATGMAITSMILGIVALLMSCCVNRWFLTVLVAAGSIVLAVLALQKNTTGKGMAIAGIVCSCIAVLMGLLVTILGAALLTFFVRRIVY